MLDLACFELTFLIVDARRPPSSRNLGNWSARAIAKCCLEAAGLQKQYKLEAQRWPDRGQEAQKANFIDFHKFSWILGGFRATRASKEAAKCGRRLPGCRNSTNWRPRASQMGARRPRRLISLIFIDFHRFSLILGGFRASWARRWAEFGAACGGLWQISATPLR